MIMFRSFLDFRHEVASAMIAGDLDASYILVNPCIVFGMTCISVKPAKLLLITTSSNLAAILDF